MGIRTFSKRFLGYGALFLGGLGFLLFSSSVISPPGDVQVLVIGGGAGGTAAGLQSARMGVRTLIVEPTVWLGGMLTAAGVSATDGNHRMPAGIWGEFRQKLWDHYGGPEAVATGWVSNTQFEPHVGARIFREMAEKEPLLEVWFESELVSLKQSSKGWTAVIRRGGSKMKVRAKLVVDGTDLGDVAAMAGAAYDLGMESRHLTGESFAPETANDIVQDFTMVAILKDYGAGADKTIPRPPGYDPERFRCSCRDHCPTDTTIVDCHMMLTYGKLPGEKYMLNWPLYGNDYYANVVEKNKAARQAAYDSARMHTLRYVYYIQHELGYRHLGLADDEFPTKDRLAFYPYHREGRRIRGLVRVNAGHLTDPYAQPLYRAGAIVGDYPIDHHHRENPQAPEIEFPKVPSFNIPLGALIPANTGWLVVADKAISVSNIVNGSSRLQPVVLQIGQAAGAIAAMAVQQNRLPRDLSVRALQSALLEAGAYCMPFFDVPPSDPHFKAIQKIGATGVLRGRGEPYLWANRTWFDPDSTITKKTLFAGLSGLPIQLPAMEGVGGSPVTILEATILTARLTGKPANDHFRTAEAQWTAWGLQDFQSNRPITRRELAVLLDKLMDPFSRWDVQWDGNWKS